MSVEEIKNAAKVIEPLAKPLEKAIDVAEPVVKKATKLLDSLLGGPLREAGALIGDEIHAIRCRRRISMIARTAEILEERKVEPKALPPGFVASVLEGAGNADDDELQELWAQLLASSVQKPESRHPLLVQALKAMTADDAKSFDLICRESALTLKGVRWSLVDGLFDDAWPIPQTSVDVLQVLGLIQAGDRTPFQTVLLTITGLGRQLADSVGIPVDRLMRDAVANTGKPNPNI